MIWLYLVSLGGSAGLVGVFVRHVLAAQGYVPGFGAGLFLACAAACAYLAIQLGYLAVVRLLKPTGDAGPLFCETLSLLAALVLIPRLLNVPIAWPKPELKEWEPLIYFGLFAILHGVFKLATFFAALRATPASRIPSVVWLAGAALCGAGAYASFWQWSGSLESALQRAPEETKTYRAGAMFAVARLMPEGAIFERPLTPYPGQSLTLRWANVPDLGEDHEPFSSIYVSVVLTGVDRRTVSKTLTLKDRQWTEMRIPPRSIPDGLRSCGISWTLEKDPRWRKMLTYRPVIASRRQALLSGPFEHEVRGEGTDPNVVMIVVDGISREHLSGAGYNVSQTSASAIPKRDTTPQLDRIGHLGLAFSNAYTPAPETPAACMTLLTGVGPLRHGFLGSHAGPLPAQYKTLAELMGKRRYATVAFTEADGDANKTLGHGSGFERGFELFDPSYAADTPEGGRMNDELGIRNPEGKGASTVSSFILHPSSFHPSAGSKVTLEKARAWIDAHAEQKFFVFVRLRELRDLEWRGRYGPGFAKPGGEPASRDVYDSALAYLDAHLGEFISRLRDRETRKNTCIVLTSPFGYDFLADTAGKPVASLNETSLNVPLIVLCPGVGRAQRTDLVALQDVAPMLLTLTNALEGAVAEGADFLRTTSRAQPISMMGDPLRLTLRTELWRLVWQTNRSPFRAQSTPAGGPMELYDAAQLKKRGTAPNAVTRNTETANNFRRGLDTYLIRSQQAWTAPARPASN